MRNVQTIERVEVTPFQTASEAFTASLAALEAATEAHGVSKGASKVTAEAVKAAERVSAWLAFDAATLNPEAAEAFGVAIATAKGVKPEGFPVYRQRARDMVGDFAAFVAKADRSKANPLTVAKKAREERNANRDRLNAEAAHLEGAACDVAEGLEGFSAFQVLAEKDRDPVIGAAFAEALENRMARASVIADAARIREILRTCDDATRDAVGAVLFG